MPVVRSSVPVPGSRSARGRHRTADAVTRLLVLRRLCRGLSRGRGHLRRAQRGHGHISFSRRAGELTLHQPDAHGADSVVSGV